jgi:conjugal transfer pilus assembly protein TraW
MVKMKGKVAVALGISLSILVTSSSADMSVIGKTYKIEETSLLDTIMNTLKEKTANGEVKKMQEEMKRKSIANVENPKGANIAFVDEASIRYIDPSITLNKPVTLEDGTVIHPAGTVINPLSIRPLTKRLIFIEGTDEKQVEYAVKLHKESGLRDKIILTKGAFGDLTRKYKVRFYFDQNMQSGPQGRVTLIDEFGIKKVPSVVYQKTPQEYFLTIEEVKL